MILYMNAETLESNLKKDVSITKVNVDVLKNRILEKQKKAKFQSRIIIGSVLVSISLIGYFSG